MIICHRWCQEEEEEEEEEEEGGVVKTGKSLRKALTRYDGFCCDPELQQKCFSNPDQVSFCT